MRPRQFSDDDLLRVARECFLEHGAGVSTAVIAERLGVSHAALFKRVGSKEALLRKVLVQPFSPPWLALAARAAGNSLRRLRHARRGALGSLDAGSDAALRRCCYLRAVGIRRAVGTACLMSGAWLLLVLLVLLVLLLLRRGP